jgi:DNA-binding MarR family transcriptional regulator
MATRHRVAAGKPRGNVRKAEPRATDLRREFVAGYAIARLARLVARNATRRVADILGLTLAEWRVLLVLDDEQAARLDDVARRALLETSHASIAAAALGRKGLVERGAHPADRRLVHLRRTAGGARAVRRYLAATAAERRALWGVLSAAERRTLIGLLDRLIDAAVAGGYEDAAVGPPRRSRA